MAVPYNAYVATTRQERICRKTHKAAYGAVGAVTVIVPLIGLAIAIVLFTLGLGI